MLQLNNCIQLGLSVRTGLFTDTVSVVTFQGHPFSSQRDPVVPCQHPPRDGELPVPGAGPAGGHCPPLCPLVSHLPRVLCLVARQALVEPEHFGWSVSILSRCTQGLFLFGSRAVRARGVS